MVDSAYEKSVIMTITGDVGSGKSLLANALVQRFDADRYSTGTVQRRLAERMGITTLELNKRAETDPTIDEKIDSIFKSLERAPKNLVVDSRMAWNFLPQSVKIKLEVHPLISAQRVWGDKARIGEGYTSLEEARDRLNARKSSERDRFKRYYDVDIEDMTNYDLVINTTHMIPEAVHEIASNAVSLIRDGGTMPNIWVSPQTLMPTEAADTHPADPEIVEKLRSLDHNADQWRFEYPECTKWDDGFYTIDKGHHLVASALAARKAAIPVKLTRKKDNCAITPALIEAWEQHHDFTFEPKP